MSGAEKSRSVVDYETEDALRKALMAVAAPKDDSPSEDSKPQAAAGASASLETRNGNAEQNSNGKPLDWVLPNFDPENTETQSMKEELHRLQVLKSYLILDSEREEAFDRITGIASRFFDVPIALVSLVDLGRQWFMSNRGLGNVRETPRKDAFCSHAILSKNNILIVNDARLDFRFKDNSLVTGPPHIRFYAGAPLVCPEGTYPYIMYTQYILYYILHTPATPVADYHDRLELLLLSVACVARCSVSHFIASFKCFWCSLLTLSNNLIM